MIGTNDDERAGRLSPDGRWLAYLSVETGRGQIYVQPIPATGARWQVTQNGGKHPQWSASGRELYYVSPEMKVMAVPVSVADGALSFGTPRILLDAQPPRPQRAGVPVRGAGRRAHQRDHLERGACSSHRDAQLGVTKAVSSFCT